MTNTFSLIEALVSHAISSRLITEDDRTFCINSLLYITKTVPPASGTVSGTAGTELADILGALVEDAVTRGIIDDGIESRDIFDTRLMAAVTPLPHEVRRTFREKYSIGPECATDWFYYFSKATNYIRTDRIRKDRKWTYRSRYGDLDITINLAKPEKDPKAIAAARNTSDDRYPLCQLCAENEGYTGRIGHPARGNHRLIPVSLNGENWFMQYSPYSYYNEHCIVLNEKHVPMKVDRAAFNRLLDFIDLFPHYFIGSNADLPIVGGSILSHDHFQGGRYKFAMAKAETEEEISFKGYKDVFAGIVAWPMSVIRLHSADRSRITDLAERILNAWRKYSDPDVFIFAETDGEAHNTITPIARKRGDLYELDLVLRNNITTNEHPLGVFHPHAELHNIKKENIGLIEVMGLAVLPSRLERELEAVKQVLVSGREPGEEIAAHAEWIARLRSRHSFNEENAYAIIEAETGAVFERVLEDCGVFKRTKEGRSAFHRFIASV